MTGRVLAVASQLAQVFRFLAMLAAVLSVLSVLSDAALTRGMRALFGVRHDLLPGVGSVVARCSVINKCAMQ